ncbi:uncharacterized protein DEA37_0014933, partial [Paragonimus westermani]
MLLLTIRILTPFCREPLQRLPLLSVHCTLSTHRNFLRPNFKLLSTNKASMSCVTPDEYTCVIGREEVIDFCVRCMEKVSVCTSHSKSLANVLVAGDYRGHYSHGLNRLGISVVIHIISLEMYVVDIEKGVCVYNKEPVVVKETVSTALVNGENLLGPVVGNFAMKVAIEKARSTGIGWVAANGSNHYGIAGWYSLMAAKEGLIVSQLCTSASSSYLISPLGFVVYQYLSFGLSNKVER